MKNILLFIHFIKSTQEIINLLSTRDKEILFIDTFYDFRITPLDSLLKFLWVRCDFHKPRMVYARQTDNFEVKIVKNDIFPTFMTS